MKNIILSILISFSFCSCTSEFNSLEQAKNEVNTEGYRDGRWVDYYDSSGGLVEVLSKGYKTYSLGEFKNGDLIGDLKIFDSMGKHIMDATPFEGGASKLEKRLKLEDLQIESYKNYKNEKLFSITTFNKKGLRIAEKFYSLENGSPIRDKKIDYYESGIKKSVNGIIISPDSSLTYYYIKFNEVSFWDNLIDFKSLRSKIEQKIEQECSQKNIPIEYTIYSENLKEQPYSMEYVSFKSKTIFVGDIIKNEINNYNKNIDNERKSNDVQESSRSEKNEISTSYHTCSYCRKGFSGKGYYLYYGRDEYGNFGEHFGLSDIHDELCCSKECAERIME